jgi:putative redox protein
MIRTVVVTTSGGKFRQKVVVGPHSLIADEGTGVGGDDAGPAPHEWILAALGTCTSMTLKMFAERKGWPLDSVEVKINAHHHEGTFLLEREVHVEGDLSDDQRARLLEIAGKCPVHKTLTGPIRIDTVLRSR